jgi:hypothetical protein
VIGDWWHRWLVVVSGGVNRPRLILRGSGPCSDIRELTFSQHTQRKLFTAPTREALPVPVPVLYRTVARMPDAAENDPILGDGDGDGDDDAEFALPLAALPPLPNPDLRAVRCQATGGIAVVGWAIALAVGSTHGLAYVSNHKPAGFWDVMLGAIHIQAFLAITVHALLLWADPGEIHRSPEHCLPLPQAVLQRLRAGEPLDDLENIHNADEESTFCVRCCVWRRPPPPPADRARGRWRRWLWDDYPRIARALPCGGGKKAHHCSLCQRCVEDFDHHCGVLGRCIAGGNMPYFHALLFLAQLAALNVVVSGIGAFGALFGAQGLHWALGALGVYVVCGLCCALSSMWCN